MKKVFALLLAGLMASSLVACAKKDDEKENNFDAYVKEDVVYSQVKAENGDVFYFEISENDSSSVVITGFKGSNDPHEIVIPASVKTSDDASGTKPVTSIAARAFYATAAIKKVTIPASVVSIGDYAFAECSQLVSIDIPAQLTYLGEGAFLNCKGLTAINFPATSNLNVLPKNLFYGCSSLTSVTVPGYYETIGEAAFYQCTGLKVVVLSEGIKVVGHQAFQKTNALQDLTLPTTFTNTDAMNDQAFYGSEVLYLEGVHFSAGSPAEDYVETMLLKNAPLAD